MVLRLIIKPINAALDIILAFIPKKLLLLAIIILIIVLYYGINLGYL
tara:strand:- start:588 stop:728 length:141 start_codon:yes stop_codon:yes gene_type:complete